MTKKDQTPDVLDLKVRVIARQGNIVDVQHDPVSTANVDAVLAFGLPSDVIWVAEVGDRSLIRRV